MIQRILSLLSERMWEYLGTTIGLLASLSIAAQIRTAWNSPNPGSLSPVYLLTFLLLFLFWTLYGLRFNRKAIWMGNLIATIFQATLVGVWVFRMYH